MLVPPEPIIVTQTAPTFWIQRLVLFDKTPPTGLIREVPFHQGLNIVRTPVVNAATTNPTVEQVETKPNAASLEPHSVGKTLLVRLIRYSLGEEAILTGEERDDFLREFGDGHLVALWWLQDRPWLVVRPFGSDNPKDSFCVHSENWEDAFVPAINKLEFSSFVRQLEALTIGGLPSMETRRGRRPKWQDILGWLSRDCECGYRQANDWRFPGLYEGKGTDLRENSLILQWMCGLMNQEESTERASHWNLLQQHGQAVHRRERSAKRLANLMESISEELKKPEPDDSTFALENPTEEFHYRTRPDEMLANLNLEGNDATKAATVAVRNLEQDLAVARELLDDTRERFNRQLGTLTNIEATITRRQLGGHYGDHIGDCLQLDPKGQCKLKVEFDKNAVYSQRLSKLASWEDLNDRKEALERSTENLKTQIEELKATVANLGAELATARDVQIQIGVNLGRSIGKWESLLAEAISIDNAEAEVATETKLASDLEGNLKTSSETLDLIRQGLTERTRSAELTRYYSEVLQQIFGPDAIGKIQITGNGLEPKPNKGLMPRGRARSAMASVVAFDLAAVLASMCGVGNHPRFLVHDSPREGEMIMTFFRRIFETALWMEGLSGAKPAFQYIVTTADSPPEYATSNSKPTCLILSGDDRLLKRKY